MSWSELLAITRDQPMAGPIVSCPNDGTPLRFDLHGQPFCPFDGWRSTTAQGQSIRLWEGSGETISQSSNGQSDCATDQSDALDLAAVVPFHVDSYGAVGDGTTSDTAAIQTAVDAAAAAAIATPFPTTFPKATTIVQFGPKHYRASGLTLPGNVALVGNGTRITANIATPMITMSGFHNRVIGIYLVGRGVGAGAADCGIVVNAGSRWNSIDHLVFNNFAGRAVLDGGISNWARRLFAQNCLLDAAALTDYTGVYEVTGTDSFIRDCELTASRTSMSASGKACALVIRGANTQAQNIIAEISDHGVYIAAGATQLHLSGVRGELCRGNGWIIAGGSGRISDPMALRNSQDGDSVSDGFTVTGASTFTITNAWSESAAAPAARQRYGIYDPTASATSYNRWISPVALNNATPFFTSDSAGAAFLFPDNSPATLPTGTTTPSVAGQKLFTAANVSAVTVTNFTQGVAGQPITIRGDGQTTVAHGATINNISGAAQLLASGTWYRWVRYDGVWRQLP